MKQVLHWSDRAGRNTNWSIEMSKCYVSFELSKMMKSRLFVDFIAKLTLGMPELGHTWLLFQNGVSKQSRSEASPFLENEVGLGIKLSLCFEFSTTINPVSMKWLLVASHWSLR